MSSDSFQQSNEVRLALLEQTAVNNAELLKKMAEDLTELRRFMGMWKGLGTAFLIIGTIVGWFGDKIAATLSWLAHH